MGKIIGGVVGAIGIGVLAWNWPKIEKKWPAISKAFKHCFSAMASNISKAFAKLKTKIEVRFYSKDFNRFEYHYNTHGKEFANKPGKNGKRKMVF